MEVLVTAEELLEMADELWNFTKNLKIHLACMERDIYATSSFWKGDGNAAFLWHYNKSRDQQKSMIRRFEERVRDLQKMVSREGL